VDQVDLLVHAVSVLESEQIPYLLVGSLASGVYGEPRLTHDIDIVVDLKFGNLEALCAAFPAPEFYLSKDAAVQALRTERQFNVLHPSSGNKIDFMISRRDPWGQSQLLRRRREILVPGCEGYTAAPEDIIVSKLQCFHEGRSEKHVRDIVGILDLSRDRIDIEYVQHWVAQLKLTDEWDHILRQMNKAR
jgi:hypothetical protein